LWDQYADWYIEISKTRLYKTAGGGDEEEAKAAQRVLVYVLDTSLRLLHPYMPFVTEKLWHHLPRSAASTEKAANALMLSDWPQMDDAHPLVTSESDVNQFKTFQALTRAIRNARAEYNVEPGRRIGAIVVASGSTLQQLEAEAKSLVALAKLEPDQLSFYEAGSDKARQAMEQEGVQLVIQDGVEAYLPMSGLVDPVKERQRLSKKKEKLQADISKLAGRLNSAGFVDKAPAAVVEKARAELQELEEQAAKVQASLDSLS
jgi:valyl-tRNA synthetase